MYHSTHRQFTYKIIPYLLVSGFWQTVAWDSEAMYGCRCDSSWEVGLGAGQRQQAEYFGADCAQRKSGVRRRTLVFCTLIPSLFCSTKSAPKVSIIFNITGGHS